jgi:hypothetical protein
MAAAIRAELARGQTERTGPVADPTSHRQIAYSITDLNLLGHGGDAPVVSGCAPVDGFAFGHVRQLAAVASPLRCGPARSRCSEAHRVWWRLCNHGRVRAGPAPSKFSEEFRERAKGMVREARAKEPGPSINAAFGSVRWLCTAGGTAARWIRRFRGQRHARGGAAPLGVEASPGRELALTGEGGLRLAPDADTSSEVDPVRQGGCRSCLPLTRRSSGVAPYTLFVWASSGSR